MRVLTAALSQQESMTSPMSINRDVEKSIMVQPNQEVALNVWTRNDFHDVILREKKKAIETTSITYTGHGMDEP